MNNKLDMVSVVRVKDSMVLDFMYYIDDDGGDHLHWNGFFSILHS